MMNPASVESFATAAIHESDRKAKLSHAFFPAGVFQGCLGVLAGVVLLTGCTQLDEAVGKAKTAPDAFEVVVRPPLTLPPNFTLRPDTADTASAAESGGSSLDQAPAAPDAVTRADQVLTSGTRSDASGFAGLFGTAEANPDIRKIIDEETLGIQIERRLPIEVLFGGTPDVGPDLNAAAEARRIRSALQDNASLTATPTPAVDPVFKEPVAID